MVVSELTDLGTAAVAVTHEVQDEGCSTLLVFSFPMPGASPGEVQWSVEPSGLVAWSSPRGAGGAASEPVTWHEVSVDRPLDHERARARLEAEVLTVSVPLEAGDRSQPRRAERS